LKLPFAITPPDRAGRALRPALLPALLALLLLALLVFQITLPANDALPTGGGRVVTSRPPERLVAPVLPDAALQASSLFSPVRAGAASTGAPGQGAASGPLGGAVPVGVTRSRGVTRLILQTSTGETASLALGRSYNGWRFTALSGDTARFARDGKSLLLPLAGGTEWGGPPSRSQLANER
jgi:hypothetical protein